MQPTSIDHVALWVKNRDAFAHLLCNTLEVHIIERTDRFTLVGATAKAGKFTLFDWTGPETTEPDNIASITVSASNGVSYEPIIAENGLVITCVEHANLPHHSLLGLSLRSSDPVVAAAAYESKFGGHVRNATPDVAVVEIGDAGQAITLVKERFEPALAPMLNHLGLLVESASAHIEEAHEQDIEVVNVVETDNTSAVFLRGPDDVTLEYIEHKPEFALV